MLTSTVYRSQAAQRLRKGTAAVRYPFLGSRATWLGRQDRGPSPVRWSVRSENRRSGSGTTARRSAASSHAAHRRGSCPGLPGCLSLTTAQAPRSAANASWMVSVRLCIEFCFTNRSLFDVAQACLCGNTQNMGACRVRWAKSHLIAGNPLATFAPSRSSPQAPAFLFVCVPAATSAARRHQRKCACVESN